MKRNLNIFTPRENRKISFKQKNLYLNIYSICNKSSNHKYSSDFTQQSRHTQKSQNGNKSESCNLIF